MKISRFATPFISLSIIIAFFMPWIRGEGSIIKSVDDTTKQLQKVDATGLTKGVVQSTKGIVDKTTEVFTGIRLKQTLSGFQISLSKNKSIKKIGTKVNLVYIPPFLAFLCALLSLLRKQRFWCIVWQFFLALSMFLVLNLFVTFLHTEGLFAKVWPCCGLVFTQYAFLAIAIMGFLEMMVSAKQSYTIIRSK